MRPHYNNMNKYSSMCARRTYCPDSKTGGSARMAHHSSTALSHWGCGTTTGHSSSRVAAHTCRCTQRWGARGSSRLDSLAAARVSLAAAAAESPASAHNTRKRLYRLICERRTNGQSPAQSQSLEPAGNNTRGGTVRKVHTGMKRTSEAAGMDLHVSRLGVLCLVCRRSTLLL